MIDTSYIEVFEKATGNVPYPYQVRMATYEQIPSLVSVPTGLGKTAAVILGWAWRRRFANEKIRRGTPRRLVYCLPMRVLVEQTRDCVARWLGNLALIAENAPVEHPADKIAVHVLMGGDVERDWDRWPDRDQILIGTQDMLLSRALNRGFAMSRFRWPIQFGLLNSDCLWVMDEVQLMGNGLATTAQLQAFRRKLGAVGAARSMWMSATMRPEWLSTVDFEVAADAPGMIALNDDDHALPAVAKRFLASKPIFPAQTGVAGDVVKEAKLVLEKHASATLSLVVVNTVKRAVAFHQEIAKRCKNGEVLLLHSRFRAPDRKAIIAQLYSDVPPAGRIVVSTQVVEAGVDLSARKLFTDLAPWSSMVQRFGRCNRAGDLNGAEIYWFDAGKTAAPYTADDLAAARQKLSALSDASLAKLPEVDAEMPFSHVIRRKDVVDLFDTTPDLAGADIDISRFIRETDEHDVQVFWRDIQDKPAESERAPSRDELCRVPIGEIDLKSRRMWRWDHLENAWLRPSAVYPGMILMARACDGGYCSHKGWTGNPHDVVPPLPEQKTATPEGDTDDHCAVTSSWKTLTEHTNDVVAQMELLALSLGPLIDRWARSLDVAARWHDVGKAHPQFQKALGQAPCPGIWGKAPSVARYERRGFRHELASAIAMLTHGLADLDAYLAASHHGKVRLSIRSLPHEVHPDDPLRRFARGVWDGDALPAADLGGGVTSTETTLDLSCMELGDGINGPSWLARMLSVRDELGPFRLTFLEAIMRAADWRASSEVRR